jgi:polyisoprenoid-binding protein YceI
MRYHFIISLICLSALTAYDKASSDIKRSPAIEYAFVEGSTVTANGQTNINLFSCVCLYKEIFPGSQTTITANGDHTEASFKNATLSVDIEALDCGNKSMNKDLYRMLKASRYPYIFIRIKDAGAVSHKPVNLSEQTKLRVEADISMAGVTKAESIIMEGKQIGENLFHFTGEHALYMTDFGIKPPTALFGVIKVSNNLLIRFDLKVKVHFIS